METVAREARRRTAAQRKAKGEDLTEDDVRIQDEQEEQEAEIKALRDQNAANNVQAQNSLDLGVLAALFITLLTLSRFGTSTHTLAFFLLLSQIILLPLSFTPSWLGHLAGPARDFHVYVCGAQLVVLLIALQLLFGAGGWGAYDIARWSLPFVVSGAVEYQRRGERDMEKRLEGWERSKYPAKGA